MREYHLEDSLSNGLKIKVKNDKDCIFCKHCEVFWDYTNGPYMLICGMNRPECSETKTWEEHTCELFEE